VTALSSLWAHRVTRVKPPNNHMQRTVQQRRFASGRTRQLSRELLPAATRRENQELKTDAPSGHGLAAAFGRRNPVVMAMKDVQ
jgi:hypothetical protein